MKTSEIMGTHSIWIAIDGGTVITYAMRIPSHHGCAGVVIRHGGSMVFVPNVDVKETQGGRGELIPRNMDYRNA